MRFSLLECECRCICVGGWSPPIILQYGSHGRMRFDYRAVVKRGVPFKWLQTHLDKIASSRALLIRSFLISNAGTIS